MILYVLVFLVASFHFQDVRATNSNGIEEVNKSQKSAGKCEGVCKNGATCILDEVEDEPRCECQSRFAGKVCEVDRCAGVCLNEGFCTWDEKTDEAKCECMPRFGGKICKTDKCVGLCENGGTCTWDEETNEGTCKCNYGFEGKTCSTDKCADLCQNGGICTWNEVDDRAICTCPNRFTGDICEIDKCNDVCQNGGTCKWDVEADLPICECLNRYSGNYCQIDSECDCGLHGDCSHENGHKICKCHPGHAELDGTCEVCNCGSNGTCHFEKGMKECICNEGFYESHGVCEDFPSLSYVVIWYETTVNILFAPPVKSDLKLLTIDVEVKTKANDYLLYDVKANEHGAFQLEYHLTDRHPQEFRYRIETNMGISRWSHWNTMSDPQRRYEPPTILAPVNGSLFHPGFFLVKWEAPHPDDWVDLFELRLSTVPEGLQSDLIILQRNSNQSFYESELNAKREQQDYKLRVVAVRQFDVSRETTVFFRTLPYGVPREKPINRALFIMVIVGGVILGVVFLSLCIRGCVKRSR